MNSMQTTDWDKASNALRANVSMMPMGQERTIRRIIGEAIWSPLQREERHRFGKHVRANLDHYGLVYSRKAGRVVVYTKSAI